jgi:broad specificity phosphatase PhoE
MEIYLVRHGESTANRDGIIQGQLNTQLTILGKQQARLVANRLKDYNFDYIYSSDLKRAKNTANQINYHHNKKLILDLRLREINRGKWQGEKKTEVNFEELEGTNLERKPFGGESIIEQDKRIQEFIADLIKNHKSENRKILIVSHGGSMRYLLKNIFDIKLSKSNKIKKPSNSSFYHITYSSEKPKYIINNCNKHLRELE